MLHELFDVNIHLNYQLIFIVTFLCRNNARYLWKRIPQAIKTVSFFVCFQLV